MHLKLAYVDMRACLVYNFFLSGFMVVKFKSRQQISILVKLNKITYIFVFKSFSYDLRYQYQARRHGGGGGCDGSERTPPPPSPRAE